MKAIQTKVLPATNTKPTRMRADAEGVRSIIMSMSYVEHQLASVGLPETEENKHRVMAIALATTYQWPTVLASGGLPGGAWAHCFID